MERSNRRITFLGPDGARERYIDGEGEGPGEFRAITSAYQWPGDSIVVFHVQLRRLTLFDGSGELGRTFALAVTDEDCLLGVLTDELEVEQVVSAPLAR